jgi:N-acetylmuramoyl-L-alanine amidase
MFHRLLTAVAVWVMLGTSMLAAKTVVVLDPGHGGHDRGTYWGGVAEKHVTLSIAKRVEQQLKARGFSTAMTRRSDTSRTLDGRAAMANGYRQSILVSIHCNADPKCDARGIETYYGGARGRKLAASIHSNVRSRTGSPSRGIKCCRFAVLRKTSCPAALVECGFLSSTRERRLLTSSGYQDRMARGIADGIARSVNR